MVWNTKTYRPFAGPRSVSVSFFFQVYGWLLLTRVKFTPQARTSSVIPPPPHTHTHTQPPTPWQSWGAVVQPDLHTSTSTFTSNCNSTNPKKKNRSHGFASWPEFSHAHDFRAGSRLFPASGKRNGEWRNQLILIKFSRCDLSKDLSWAWRG